MRLVSVEELTNYKTLPFNLFNANNEVIFNEGEQITPGKLLQLRYVSALYADDDETSQETIAQEFEEAIQDTVPEESIDNTLQDIQVQEEPEPEFPKPMPETEEEVEEEPLYEMSTYENEMNCIPVKAQLDIKKEFTKAIKVTHDEGVEKSRDIYIDVRDKIVEETLQAVDNIVYKSQLKVYGDYNYTHGINVSILSTLLAYKLKLSDSQIKDIALAAMLHDIGKVKIPKEILDKQALTTKESKLVQLHPQIGYRLIKKEMGLPENIAIVALEHHERNDGSGYPYGISGDLISLQSQIIMICDAFDNLISNRSIIKVKNAKEAIKTLLDGGSKWFTPSILYTFVYMSNYNDTLPLSAQ